MRDWIKSHEYLVIVLSAVLFVVVVYGSLFIYLDHSHKEYVASHSEETVETGDVSVDSTYDESVGDYARWWYYQNFLIW